MTKLNCQVIINLYRDYKSGIESSDLIKKYSDRYQENELEQILSAFESLPLNYNNSSEYKVLKYSLWFSLLLKLLPILLGGAVLFLSGSPIFALLALFFGFFVPVSSLIMLYKETDNAFGIIFIFWLLTLTYSVDNIFEPGFFAFSSPAETTFSIIGLLSLFFAIVILYSSYKLFRSYKPLLVKIDKIVRKEFST